MKEPSPMVALESRNLIGENETVYKRRSLPGRIPGLPTDHSIFLEGMQHPRSIGEIHKHQRGFPNRTERPSGKGKSGLGQNPNDKAGKFRRGGGRRSFWFRVVCLTGGVSLLLLAFRRKGIPPPGGGIRKSPPEAPEYQWAATDLKPYTLGELLKLTPTDGNTRGVADVTAILTDSASLEVQLYALLYSSVKIAEVWVTMPAKRALGSRHGVTERFRREFRGRLHLVKSDLFSSMADEDEEGGESLGGGDGSFFDETFGRFQLAMQAHTRYVWVINPDVVPGPKFLELLWRVSDSGEITGALGGDGAVMSAVPNGEWRATMNDGDDLDPYLDSEEMEVGRRKAGVAEREDEAIDRALVLTPVDVLFSQWFLHRDLVRLVFREKLAFSKGGGAAAMTLSYSLRRFAGIQSYVLPLDADLPDYVANVSPSERAALSAAAAASLAESLGRKSFPRRSTSEISLVPGQSVTPLQSNLLRGDEGLVERGERGGGAEEDGGLEWYRHRHRRLVNLPSKSQFRELMARGGRFISTPFQCPSELVVLVVDGRRQAELLGPLYRGLVASAEGVGAEVFVAVIEGPEGREEEEEEERWDSGERRKAPTECTEVAGALGVSPRVTVAKAAVNPAAETPVEGFDGPKTRRLDEFNKRFGGYLDDGGGGDGRMKPDPVNWRPFDWARRGISLRKGGGASMEEGRNIFPRSHHFLTPEEFCLGDAFGVFHIHVGQDYPRIAERHLDPFLEVFYGLAEVLDLVKPKIVAYVDSSSVAKVLPPGMSSTVQQGLRPEDVVVRAIEAAVRSSGGGPKAPTRPIAVALPDSDVGAAAARAMAYLPRGSLERWKKPEIVLVLVHQRKDSANLLAMTLESLADAHYLGDHVELRVVLHAGAAGDAEIEGILHSVDWRWGQKDVTYFHDGSGRAGSPELPGGLAALQAFPTPDWHRHVIPLFSGGRLDPSFYVWLKVALMNEGYSSRPVQGSPFDAKEKRGAFAGGWGGAEDHAKDEDNDEDHYHDDETKRWGKFLALSVDIPRGLCPGGDDCSRVWMYGSVAWGALMERCRLAAASKPPPGFLSAEALDVACAVGNRAERTSDVWGIRESHVCGAGPPLKTPVVYPERLEGWKAEEATRWQSAKVWNVRGLSAAVETFS